MPVCLGFQKPNKSMVKKYKDHDHDHDHKLLKKLFQATSGLPSGLPDRLLV